MIFYFKKGEKTGKNLSMLSEGRFFLYKEKPYLVLSRSGDVFGLEEEAVMEMSPGSKVIPLKGKIVFEFAEE